MAESQEQIDYSKLLLTELERTLSPARLAPYVRIAGNNRKFAIQLYLWNARLSKAFLFPLNVAEVTVRNAIHQSLTNKFGTPDWVFNPPFQQTDESVRSHKTAYRRLQTGWDPHMPPITADDLIAALNFDFWSNLFRREYDPLWTQPGILATAFPHLPAGETQRDIQRRVQKVNLFRNRIAHHEPIHRAKHRDYLDTVLDLIGLVSPDTRNWVESCATVMSVVRTPPTADTNIPGLPLASTSIRPPPQLATADTLANLLAALKGKRPAIALVDQVPVAAVSLEMVSDYIAKRATDQGGMIDLNEETVAKLLEIAPPLRTADIDITQSTGDLQALFFPPNVPQNQRPQVAIIRRAAVAVGVALHPGIRYR